MIDYSLEELFSSLSTNKQLIITNSDSSVVLTNGEIYYESMKFSESLCSTEELTFGACEASQISFDCVCSQPLMGDVITVTMILDEHDEDEELFTLGRYLVVEDTPYMDSPKRSITAYDYIYYINNLNVVDWWTQLVLPDTLKNVRDSFFEFVGIEQEETTLINDDMLVHYYEAGNMVGSDFLKALCEVNGVFGRMSRTGTFQYVTLQPIDEDTHMAEEMYDGGTVDRVLTKNDYNECSYSDYVCQKITQLRVKDQNGEIFYVYGDDDTNPYTLGTCFLLWNKDDISDYAENIFNAIKDIWYVPVEYESICDPCIQVGDRIELKNDNYIVYSYLLTRSVSGIQCFIEEIDSQGVGTYSIDEMGIAKEISELRTEAMSNRLYFYNYTNVDAININAGSTKTIINIPVVTTDDTSLIFLAALRLTATSAADEEITKTVSIDGNSSVVIFEKPKPTKAIVHYYWEDEELDFHPTEQWDEDGLHTPNLFYVVKNVPANTVSKLIVAVEMVDGNLSIQPYDIQASIAAQGVKGLGAEWDGRIEVSDEIPKFVVTQDIPFFNNIVETASVNLINKVTASASVSVSSFVVTQDIPFFGVSDSDIAFSYIIKSATRDMANSGDFEYDTTYVQKSEDNYAILKNQMTFADEIISIDSGYATATEIPTSDLASMSSIIFTEVI